MYAQDIYIRAFLVGRCEVWPKRSPKDKCWKEGFARCSFEVGVDPSVKISKKDHKTRRNCHDFDHPPN